MRLKETIGAPEHVDNTGLGYDPGAVKLGEELAAATNPGVCVPHDGTQSLGTSEAQSTPEMEKRLDQPAEVTHPATQTSPPGHGNNITRPSAPPVSRPLSCTRTPNLPPHASTSTSSSHMESTPQQTSYSFSTARPRWGRKFPLGPTSKSPSDEMTATISGPTPKSSLATTFTNHTANSFCSMPRSGDPSCLPGAEVVGRICTSPSSTQK